MTTIVNHYRLYRYMGKVDSYDLLMAVVFGIALDLSTRSGIGSVGGSMWVGICAYLLIKGTFGNRTSLASSLGWPESRQIGHAMAMYYSVGLLFYIAFKLAGNAVMIMMLAFGNGGMDLSTVLSYNPVNLVYDILIMAVTMTLFFPACFIDRLGLKVLWLMTAAGIRLGYGWFIFVLMTSDTDQLIMKGQDVTEWFFVGTMDLLPLAWLHLILLGIVAVVLVPFSRWISIKVLIHHNRFASNTHCEKGLITVGLVILGLLALAIGTMVTVSVRSISEKPQYEEVATCLTESYLRGPVVFEGEVYVCASEDEVFPDENNSEVIGYFTFKGEEIDWLYVSLMENFVYVDKEDDQHNYLKMSGGDRAYYIKASESELKSLDEYGVYTIEPTDRDERDVRIEIDKELVETMEARYGFVEYKVEDFENYDASYSVVSYPNHLWAESESYNVWPQFIGCILEIDGNYYYGNTENLITGDLLEVLLSTI